MLARRYQDRNPVATVTAGQRALVVGDNDLNLLQFAWADTDSGQVSQISQNGEFIGFALPTYRMWDWNRVYLSVPSECGQPCDWPVLRSGMPVVLASQGQLRAYFSQGAQAGQRVWANPSSGAASSGDGYGQDVFLTDSNGQYVLDSDGARIVTNDVHFIPTPWCVMEYCECGEWALISTYATPFLS